MNKKNKPVRKQKDTHSALYYAMPWNLKKEIGALGYAFSTSRIVLIYAIIIFIMVGCGVAFKLTVPWMIPLVIAGLWFAPTIVRNSYKNKWELKRFSDVNVYIEQMLYAFKNSQKVLTALQDVSILFPEGAMHEVIDQAIDMIADPSSAKSSEDIEAKALGLIEARYPNQYIKSLHRFMLKVESIGGDFDSSIQLLLDNRAMWENRIYKLQDKRRQKRSQMIGSCVASGGLCLAMLYILPSKVDISTMLPVCIANVLMTIALFAVFLKADKKLSSNLLRERKESDDSKIIADYHRYINYDKKREFVKSLKFAIIPVVIIVVGYFICHNTIAGVVGVILLPIMLTQHILGHRLLGKRLRREISVAFPQWLMELALLLQSDNVQVAIFKTVDTALPVMQPELKKMRRELMAHPDSSEPFLRFFHEFQMFEITTSMQMLYSLSTGSGGDADEQISNIVKRNNIILDRNEDMANDNSMAGLYTLFLMPVVLGAAVLMVDMTCFLMAFMSDMNI